MVHVPLVRAGSLMGIFQHTPLPMPAGNNLYVSINSGHDTIAVSPDLDHFFLTDITSLQLDCTRIGEFFACPRGNVARKSSAAEDFTDDPAACLLALFKADHVRANSVCDKHFVRPAPTVYQISARRFVTYGATSGTLYCRGSTFMTCLLYTSPSPRDKRQSRMPSSA